MMIESESDPYDIIKLIGNKPFTIATNLDEVRIIDREGDIRIDIFSYKGDENALKIANAMLRLLNQEYKFRPAGE